MSVMPRFGFPVAAMLSVASAAFPASAQSASANSAAPMTQPGKYQNFAVAVYIPVGIVHQLADPERLRREWEQISRQVKVDKVYIESHRDRVVADDGLLESLKTFFAAQGVRTAGGITYSDGGDGGQFRSFCYTDPADRAFIQRVAELTARHFDEIILDDFFFVTTKYESDIAAKGGRSWTQFRLDLMNQAGRELVLEPARAVNPRARVIIKYPNWYEHFAGLGFDLAEGPRLFDGIYTGTETRDPVSTDQFLQPYESYQILRYFENIAPGRNGGGWVDTFSIRYVDRYAEQLWDTMFAKAREMTLFNWALLLRPIVPGERAAWQSQPTSFDYDAVLKTYHATQPPGAPAPTLARVAGHALEQVDAVLGRLGTPIGIKSYRPPHALGEDFLHNYLGMLGIPIDLHPTFPVDANPVLLTESAAADPAIVDRLKQHLLAGKSAVITSGLLRALQGRGIEDIVEAGHTGRSLIADGYTTGFGAGSRIPVADDGTARSRVIFPQLRFLTNDAWALVSAMSDDVGVPLLLMDRYGRQGVLYIWTMPDNFHHLYRLPPEVLGAVKDVVMNGFFVRLDGPSEIALFAYDNRTFVVHSYLSKPAKVKIGILGLATQLRDLVSGEAYTPPPMPEAKSRGEGPPEETRVTFEIDVLPHSFRVFAAEK